MQYMCTCLTLYIAPAYIYTPDQLMDINTFREHLDTLPPDSITPAIFFNALMKSIPGVEKTPSLLKKYKNAAGDEEARIIGIGLDIYDWLNKPTPESRQIAYVSVHAWAHKFPDPWETI